MRFNQLAATLNDWCDLEDINFVAEDTILTVYRKSLFVGALYWIINADEPLTIFVKLSENPNQADTIHNVRLYLIRTLSALLPAYVMIRGNNIKI